MPKQVSPQDRLTEIKGQRQLIAHLIVQRDAAKEHLAETKAALAAAANDLLCIIDGPMLPLSDKPQPGDS